MKSADFDALFGRLEADDPAPGAELEHADPYGLLVAVVLAARATDATVNKATRGLFQVAGTPAEMVALGEERLRELIKTISLYKGKARNVSGLSRILVEQHGGGVPQTREALEALPGVGRKTASVVLATAFGEPAIAVDTHVFRVANRTGLAPGAKPADVERALEAVVPDGWKSRAAAWLVLHGRYVCKARKPDCPTCRIRGFCTYPDKTPG